MSNLSIKDMPRNEAMDSNDMAAIEGGISFPLNVAAVKLQPTKSGSYTNGDPGSGNLGIGVGPNSGGADDVGTYDNGPGDFIEHSSDSDSLRQP
jgi:hypothetical protein